MGKFKTLLIEVLYLHSLGYTVAEIAQRLQVGRSVVEYALEEYGEAVA